jgi:ketosteroid isomerase-like protein
VLIFGLHYMRREFPRLRSRLPTLDEFGILATKEDAVFSKSDASALAALFTEDGVLVAPDGMFFGRQAIEKRYADLFQQSPITTYYGHRSQLNAIDNAVGRSENGGVLFKATLALCSAMAMHRRFMFMREMLGRSAR